MADPLDQALLRRFGVTKEGTVRRGTPDPSALPAADKPSELAQRENALDEAIDILAGPSRKAKREEKLRLASWAPVYERAVPGALVGGATGAMFGGPPGALAGAAIGTGAGVLGGLVEKKTEDPVLGTLVETVADPLMAVGGGLLKRSTSAARAARGLLAGEMTEGLGERGALGASEAVEMGVRGMKQDVDMAYDLARQAAPDAAVSPELVEQAIGPKTYRRLAEGFDDPNWSATDYVDWNRLDRIRSRLGGEAAERARAGNVDEARELFARRDRLDQVYDELARASGDDEALDLLQTARARNVEYRDVYPAKGRPGQKLLRGVVEPLESGERLQPDDWFHSVMSNKKGRLNAYRQAREAARRGGNLEQFEKDFRTAYLEWLPTRGAGGVTAAATHKAPTLAKKLAATDDVAQRIFTKRQYQYLKENIEALAEMEGGSSLSTTLRTRRPVLDQVYPLIAGGAVGGALGGGEGLALGAAVGSGKYVIQKVADLYGPKMARTLGVQALYNPDLMLKLSKAVGSGASRGAVNRVMEFAVRRGILTVDDIAEANFGDEESKGTDEVMASQ